MHGPGPRPPLRGTELRRLLVLRGRLRDEVAGAPRRVQREVLRALELARRLRLEGCARPWTPPAMAPDELLREIKWRVDVASLAEVSAAVRVLDRARRGGAWRTLRGPGRRASRAR
ncbi:MAG: hypothetical protein QN168_13510 [Armatimonadota bacterium]|nr:hypothetical protein [Armatimonadota bacterium]